MRSNPISYPFPMSRRLLFLTLLVFALFSTAAKAEDAQFYTRDFPQPDHGEIIDLLTPSAADGPHAKLNASRAREMAKLIRGLKWLGPAGSCDKAQYEMRLYAGKKLIAADAICFNCGCFAPIESDLHGPADPLTFDLSTTDAKRLEKFLAGLFPDAG